MQDLKLVKFVLYITSIKSNDRINPCNHNFVSTVMFKSIYFTRVQEKRRQKYKNNTLDSLARKPKKKLKAYRIWASFLHIHEINIQI